MKTGSKRGTRATEWWANGRIEEMIHFSLGPFWRTRKVDQLRLATIMANRRRQL